MEEYYRKRTILGTSATSDDIAASIDFLAPSQAATVTGCSTTVDGGVPTDFTR